MSHDIPPADGCLEEAETQPVQAVWKSTLYEIGIVVPARLSELGTWATSNLHEGVIVLPRAAHAAKKLSKKYDPDYAALVYEGLLFLADAYYESVFQPSPETHQKYLRQQKIVGVSVVQHVPLSNKRKHYQAMWQGATVLLDHHLKPNRVSPPLRIYFALDHNQKKIVIGSLPEHLPY